MSLSTAMFRTRLAHTARRQLPARRWYAAGVSGDVGKDAKAGQPLLPGIDALQLQVNKTASPKQLPAPGAPLLFGRTFTDHMLKIRWTEQAGWEAPQIEPYGTINLVPSAVVIHYAQSAFEGMKAYKRADGNVTMFRPDMNMKRLNNSAARLALPTFDGEQVIELLKQLIRLDKEWVPEAPGHSLYIRPTLIGTNGTLGVQPPTEALLFVICSPVGPYYPTGFKPVPLYGTTEYIRAAPGGTGAYKLAVNYAPGVVAQKAAASAGYQQNLWLHGPEHYITEVGTMNAFIVFHDADGGLELVTPPLDGMILPGVTRDSVLALARGHAAGARIEGMPVGKKVRVSERPVTMEEVSEASTSGRLVELFGTGTAAVITPVEKIGYQGSDVLIPTGPGGMGPISGPIWKHLTGIQNGLIEHEWNVVV
ncbi:branched-chain amino acid aminotransferase II [Coniophora puteana RWD-64-598 SS2]|uniref:Branched-chain-amino-acid aminotransferase n=1 Tax=Coniophora puteana (strain RWD-64-598) TaxID=741705 RepID=A0A5M3N601_CONPW|nr:branched-chain amino acid aminotransferase II [Coniophora puteana RWD-64-598 SS2]EIW86504.1 branched-chain amino acid aminotransferase II [Coniophora puteana RWD-64-598 SS2]